jgi:hypothetical protein
MENKPILYRSNRKNKKYVLVYMGKPIHFGQRGYRDYVLMNQRNSRFYQPAIEREKAKFRYLKRHQNDRLDEISPGALSYFLLWNRPTIKESLKDFKVLFDIEILDNSDEVYKKIN